MRGKWLYLSMIGAFGVFYGLGMPLPAGFGLTSKEFRPILTTEEVPVPLVKGYRYILSLIWPTSQPPPRIARPPQPPPAAPVAAPVAAPEPPAPAARQFVEPPRAGKQGFTALAGP